jgi:DNA-binding response OmpR family regulator
MEQKHSVLVVDDDQEIANAIAIYLKQADLSASLAFDGAEALEALEDADFHLIIMDIMMPKLDGIQAMLKIREEKNIPIILLSAKSEDTDKILGLTMGADDYITKPFNPLELIARVKSQLRRYTTFGAAVLNSTAITTGTLSLDTELKLVTVDGEEIKLTPIEFKILRLLMQNVGRIFSIDEIYERVWDELNINGQNTVAVHIRRIREKIEINPKEPKYLKVVWGIGYKIEKY